MKNIESQNAPRSEPPFPRENRFLHGSERPDVLRPIIPPQSERYLDQGTFDAAVTFAIANGYFRNPSTVDIATSTQDGGFILLRRPAGKRIVTKIQASLVARTQARIWAISMGYIVPTQPGGCLSSFLIVVGLCTYIIPGILIWYWFRSQANQYERDMRALVEKWIDAGRPAPGVLRAP